MQFLGSIATAFGLGFIYFISAIPVTAAIGLPVWIAAIAAWLGYSAGGVVVAYAGAPLRAWLMRKLKIRPPEAQERPSLIVRAWRRYGLVALGFLAPVTVGPQAGALLGLALGAARSRLVLAISLGALPWAVTFAVLTAFGVKLVK
jgi:hypothetical protein